MEPLAELFLLSGSQISNYWQFSSYWAQNLKVTTLYFKITILKIVFYYKLET